MKGDNVMLLIAEIVLTICAWRKGWRARALLPVGIGIGAAFVVGLAVGTSGGNPEDIVGISILIEFAMIISLIVMMVKSPMSKTKASESQAEILMKKTAA
jgi:heme A synthase